MEPKHSMKEEASLYALGLLDECESKAFEKAARTDSKLALERDQAEEAIAAIALTAPPQAAPDLLSSIHAGLGLGREDGKKPSKAASFLPHLGWAAAACFMGGLAVSYHNTNSLRRELLSLKENVSQPTESPSTITAQPLFTDSDREIIDKILLGAGSGSAGARSLVPVETLRGLRNKLDRYVAMHDSRFDPVPGLARWVVTEMRNPADQDSESSTRVFDAQDIANVMAAAIEASDSANGEPLVLEGSDGRWNGQVKIVNGMLDLGNFNLSEDTVIIQEDFPEEDWEDIPSLEQLGDGRFYHSDSDYLYERAEDGQYIGTRPPEGFDPEADVPPVLTNTSPETSETVTPKAITYFNEVTGNGSVYVRDLPPLEEGFNYHLWLTDTASDEIISVGPLPSTGGNAELIDFPHGLLGTTPSAYLLTRETLANPKSPNQSDTLLVWP